MKLLEELFFVECTMISKIDGATQIDLIFIHVRNDSILLQ